MKKLILIAATMALSSAAVAGPAWTYVDAGLVLSDTSGEDTSAGGKFTGSFGFDIFHANLSYLDIADVGVLEGEKVDFQAARIGLGIHPAITDNTDMVVEIGYTDAEIDIDNVSDDPEPSGVDLQFGVRSMIADNFELNATILFFYGDTDTGSDLSLSELALLNSWSQTSDFAGELALSRLSVVGVALCFLESM